MTCEEEGKSRRASTAHTEAEALSNSKELKKRAKRIKRVIDAGLGFPEELIKAAFDKLIESYGGCIEEAWVWISRDNYTLLVDFILNHQASLCQGAVPDLSTGINQLAGTENASNLHSSAGIKPIKLGNEQKVSHKAFQMSVWEHKKTDSMEKPGNADSSRRTVSTLQDASKSTHNIRASRDKLEQSSSKTATSNRNCLNITDTSIDSSNTQKGSIEKLAIVESRQNALSKTKICDSIHAVNLEEAGVVGLKKANTGNLVKSDQNLKVLKRSLDWSSSSFETANKDRVQRRKTSIYKQSFMRRQNTLDEQPCDESRYQVEKYSATYVSAAADDAVHSGTKCLVALNKKKTNKRGNFDAENMTGSCSAETARMKTTSILKEEEGKHHKDDHRIKGRRRRTVNNTSEGIHVKDRDAVLLSTNFSARMGNEDLKIVKSTRANVLAEEVKGWKDEAVIKESMGNMICNLPPGVHMKSRNAVSISSNPSVAMEEEESKNKFINSEIGRQLFRPLEQLLKARDPDRALQFLSSWMNKEQPCCVATNETERILRIQDKESAMAIVPSSSGDQRGIIEHKENHELIPDVPLKRSGVVVSYDLSRGLERNPISCVNEYNTQVLPEDFLYITRSVIFADAHINTSFSRIGDLHCDCSGDCLRSSPPCKCTDSTRGEYAYDEDGLLIGRLATSFHSSYATENGDFIVECCPKCRCSMNCGNRVVQRGITKKLQVFMTPNKKGWGVRSLELIPARSFVYEYIGEITTNEEQYYRNQKYMVNKVHTYTMNLDADFDMERRHFKEGLTDAEALVLDATNFGNISRFMNHRCNDANLFFRPVQIETRDTHYYHVAFFAARDIKEMEELTWDYGIDFEDNTHQVKAFKCRCHSQFCRDKLRSKPYQSTPLGNKKNVL